MALLVDLEQAVANALQVYLSSTLGVDVDSRWPDPDKVIQANKITLLRAGDPDYQDCDPVVIKSTPPVSGNAGTYVWRYATASLAFQLDVWCTSKPERSDLITRVRDALTASKTATLSSSFLSSVGAGIQDPLEHAIYLQLVAPWDHIIAEYDFARPSFADTPEAASRREWRATCEGTCFYDVTKTVQSPRLNQIKVDAYVSTDPSLTMPTSTSTNEIATITATSITHTRGPR